MNNLLLDFYASELNRFEAAAFNAYHKHDMNSYRWLRNGGRSFLVALLNKGFKVSFDRRKRSYVVSE